MQIRKFWIFDSDRDLKLFPLKWFFYQLSILLNNLTSPKMRDLLMNIGLQMYCYLLRFLLRSFKIECKAWIGTTIHGEYKDATHDTFKTQKIMNTKTQIFELIGLPYHWRDDLRVLVVDHSLNKLMPNLMCFDAVIVLVYLSTNGSCRSKVQIFFDNHDIRYKELLRYLVF